MMKPKAKTKGQFALELGISESTLRRRLKNHRIPLTGQLLSPLEQAAIRRALGFPPPDWMVDPKSEALRDESDFDPT